ncbi:MAG: rRNA pseudouridine synthase [Trueperaceae bacterium]|nr:rRNA pseudouridine synthase [Trueperaceae bacterium]MCW5820230.1 rRNA pseudouridine synthase [Trueperaceae bacterium]
MSDDRQRRKQPSADARKRRPPQRKRPQAPREPEESLAGERVQRLIARTGIASRRGAEDLIRRGRVRINGRVAQLGDRAERGDDVRVDGKQVGEPQEHVTYVLNKPAGYVTTARDERGRATVFDLLPPTPGLHSVGRLDRDSEGLLLLTTDGDLTLRLTHPRYELEKEYRVWTKEGRLDGVTLKKLLVGIELEDGVAAARSVRPAPGGAVVVLTEGRKREVRRLFKALGYPVERLVRVRVGTVKLGDLASGAFRELGEKELRSLGYVPAERDA